ncbi:hypothetical protein FPQ18DRAFT_310034 [Pyronema domesticum]|nr:hypothetical protein FPQ18DRAFT_310034 [Pyronema domesticum]
MQYPHNNTEYCAPHGTSSPSRNIRPREDRIDEYGQWRTNVPQIRYDHTHAITAPIPTPTPYLITPQKTGQHARHNNIITANLSPTAVSMWNMGASGSQNTANQPCLTIANMTYPGPSTSYDTAGMRLTIPGGHGDRSGHSRVPISPTEVESMNNAFGAGMQFDENHPPQVFREYYQPNHQGQMALGITYDAYSSHLEVRSPSLKPSTGSLSSRRASSEHLGTSPTSERKWSISKTKMFKKACTYCHKKFANLTRHILELHTETPKQYFCSTPNCKRSIEGFTRKHNLQVHINNRSHTMISE